MQQNHLNLNGVEISYQDILKENFSYQLFTDYEVNTLKFCKSWLEGKALFTIKTSGSTGKPKTITLTRRQMILSAHRTAKALDLHKGDRSLVCISTLYIGGMMMLVRGFELGLRMFIVDPSTKPLSMISCTSKFDFAAFVPLQIQHIMEDLIPTEIKMLDRMKAIIIGGAPISDTLKKKIELIKCPVYHTYGMTETVSHIALRRMNGHAKSSFFRILEGVTIAIDERSCLIIQDDLTNQKLIKTNDIVQLKDDRHFSWIGRADYIINSGGIKLQPEKIEQLIEGVLQKLNINAAFFIGGWPDEKFGERIVLFLNQKLTSKEKKVLQYHINACLPKYEQVKEIHEGIRFIFTSTGKINRAAVLHLIHSKKDKKKR